MTTPFATTSGLAAYAEKLRFQLDANRVSFPSGADSYSTIMAGATAAAAKTGGASDLSEPPTTQKTLEDFKREFYVMIESLPVQPSMTGPSLSISIHDDAFRKMMDDPEFMDKILKTVEEFFASSYGVPSAFSTMSIDANGEYSGTAGGSAHLDKFENGARNAFWVRRTPSGKNEKAEEQRQKEKKAEELEKLLEILSERRRLQLKNMSESYQAKYLTGGTQVMYEQTLVSPVSTFAAFF